MFYLSNPDLTIPTAYYLVIKIAFIAKILNQQTFFAFDRLDGASKNLTTVPIASIKGCSLFSPTEFLFRIFYIPHLGIWLYVALNNWTDLVWI